MPRRSALRADSAAVLTAPGASRNSLRSLRSLRSDTRARRQILMRAGRAARHRCAPRRRRNRPCREARTASSTARGSRRLPPSSPQRASGAGCGAPVGRRGAQGSRPARVSAPQD